ncbi:hypothetical protein AB0J86_27130 [Micromonospora sp. NPDC049559]|uniref:hypothetical protein n=1 Tax=Micromonospora sp. NPDC049559 TaxID=3155923 RepID=UPI00342857C7
MFGIGRRRTRGELVKAELGESLGHLVRAATHAANGVGETVGPRANSAREYLAPAAGRVRETASRGMSSTMARLAPLAAAAAIGASQAGSATGKATSKKVQKMGKKRSHSARRRWSILAGLLAAGAVAGAVGTVAARRRNQADWESYDSHQMLESVREDAESIIGTSSANAPQPGASPKAAVVAEKAKAAGEPGGKAATAGEKAGAMNKTSTAERAKQPAAKGAESSDGLLGNTAAAPSSRNSHG